MLRIFYLSMLLYIWNVNEYLDVKLKMNAIKYKFQVIVKKNN